MGIRIPTIIENMKAFTVGITEIETPSYPLIASEINYSPTTLKRSPEMIAGITYERDYIIINDTTPIL